MHASRTWLRTSKEDVGTAKDTKRDKESFTNPFHVISHHEPVVKIFVTVQEPNYNAPWQRLAVSSAYGSGVVIEGRRILTCAHLVANQTFIQVQRGGISDKKRARILHVCHEADLALLELEDAEFIADIVPMALGEMPDLRDKVYVCGVCACTVSSLRLRLMVTPKFPEGGDEISITEGVVSRVEVQLYEHSHRHLLAITVDAAINNGNSGGPVIKDNLMIGIAFQSVSNLEGVGEVVPTHVIRHFLEGVERQIETGKLYEGFPALGVQTQPVLSPLLREHLGMNNDETGIRVTRINFGGSAWEHLKTGDVIMAIDGYAVNNNGTTNIRLNSTSTRLYRTNHSLLYHRHHCGEDVSLEILRNRERMCLSLPLKRARYLVPHHIYDAMPVYFIYCGLVFQPLSLDYLETWKNYRVSAPKLFVHKYTSGIITPEVTELVVLSHILADEVNVGYEEEFHDTLITRINGRAINCLRDMITRLEGEFCDEPVIVFTNNYTKELVLPGPKGAKSSTERICKKYQVPRDRSLLGDVTALPTGTHTGRE